MNNLKNYFNDPEATNIPFCESPFFYSLLPGRLEEFRKTQVKGEVGRRKTEWFEELAIHFYRHGFVKINLDLEDKFVEDLITELDTKLMEGAVKTQEGHFHYNDGPRIFEAWKWNKNVLELARNEIAMEVIEFLYGRRAIPFQTINFKLGSAQPTHSDHCHFASMPHRWVCGFWTALVDIGPNQGPLMFYPGSHKEPIYEFQDLKMSHTEYKGEKDNYTEYENFVRQLIKAKKYETEYFFAKKGEALIWAANLLHGGSAITEEGSTRWSQATHVTFLEDDIKHYTPFYSDYREGHYVLKDISSKNIRDYQLPETYPLIQAVNSEKLTRSNTFYPKEEN